MSAGLQGPIKLEPFACFARKVTSQRAGGKAKTPEGDLDHTGRGARREVPRKDEQVGCLTT